MNVSGFGFAARAFTRGCDVVFKKDVWFLLVMLLTCGLTRLLSVLSSIIRTADGRAGRGLFGTSFGKQKLAETQAIMPY